MSDGCIFCGRNQADIDAEDLEGIRELRRDFPNATNVQELEEGNFYVDYGDVRNVRFTGQPVRIVFVRIKNESGHVKWRVIESWICVGDFNLCTGGGKWAETPLEALRTNKHYRR